MLITTGSHPSILYQCFSCAQPRGCWEVTAKAAGLAGLRQTEVEQMCLSQKQSLSVKKIFILCHVSTLKILSCQTFCRNNHLPLYRNSIISLKVLHLKGSHWFFCAKQAYLCALGKQLPWIINVKAFLKKMQKGKKNVFCTGEKTKNPQNLFVSEKATLFLKVLYSVVNKGSKGKAKVLLIWNMIPVRKQPMHMAHSPQITLEYFNQSNKHS